jgi:sensor domain CHASE-containing protein
MSANRTYIVFVSCASSEELEAKLTSLEVKWTQIYDFLDDPNKPTLAFSGNYTELEVEALNQHDFVLVVREEGIYSKRLAK